jgi:septum formation protein
LGFPKKGQKKSNGFLVNFAAMFVTDFPYRVILASQSPRRQQLLRELGLRFRTELRPIDETIPPGIGASEAAGYLAGCKADEFAGALAPDELVITADTVVVSEGQALGKPAAAAEARHMLRGLSGRTHHVVTGVCALTRARRRVEQDTTLVTFRELTEAEIDYYVAQYQPFDKAGAYGIQEWIGMVGIARIEGSYFNVMGLPVHRLYQMLQEFLPGQ